MSMLAPGLLVAAPPLGDPNFERSVVLLAAHSPEGAFGWVINGPELMTLEELLDRAEVKETHNSKLPAGVVRSGGPVGPEQVWLLYPTHSRLLDLDAQFDIGSGVTACSSRRILEELARGRAPTPLLGVAGYAGWGPSQLEDEIRAGAWLPTDVEASWIFGVQSSDVWLAAYERAGTSAIAFTSRVVGLA
jgi:putative transcriptional regulator